MKLNCLRAFGCIAAVLFASSAAAHDPTEFGRMMAGKPMPTSCSELAEGVHYEQDITIPEIASLKVYCDGLVAAAAKKAAAEGTGKKPAATAKATVIEPAPKPAAKRN